MICLSYEGLQHVNVGLFELSITKTSCTANTRACDDILSKFQPRASILMATATKNLQIYHNVHKRVETGTRSTGPSNKVRGLKCHVINPPCLSHINDRWEAGRGYDVTFKTSDFVARTHRDALEAKRPAYPLFTIFSEVPSTINKLEKNDLEKNRENIASWDCGCWTQKSTKTLNIRKTGVFRHFPELKTNIPQQFRISNTILLLHLNF